MKKELVRPSLDEIHEEIQRLHSRQRSHRTIRWVLYSLAVVSAAVILVAMLWMPVLQITGSSMEPTLNDHEVVAAIRTGRFESGDVIAFYYNNKILIKRVIATSGQYVDILEDGTVLVDGEVLDEPYIQEKSRGECNIPLPYQVGEGQIFVMGDDRPVSLDSRTTSVGTVSEDKVIGRIMFKVWPWSAIGPVS